MKIKFIKTAVLIVIAILTISNIALASETTGTLSTGLSGTNGNGITGYIIKAPSASPASGTYSSAQTVSLAAEGSLSMRYSIDGSKPSCTEGAVYDNVIQVASSITIKTIACFPDNKFSTVASYAYVITSNPTPSPSPVINSGGGGGGSSYQSADLNKSGKVDKYDFALLMANWGKTGTNIADINSDGIVNKYDFAIMMAQWSK